jgi:DNA-binding NtrC family response regulator
LAENLRDDGHVVEEYSRAQEAPPMAALGSVKALIIGHQCSPHHGLAFADEFHSRYKEVPIVLLSAYWCTKMQLEAMHRTFVNLRTKPVDYEDLHSLLWPGAQGAHFPVNATAPQS